MKKELLLKATLMLVGIAPMSEVVIIPGLVKIYADFPDASSFVRNFLLTGPMLVAIPATLLCGKAAQYISKKTLLLVGYLIYLIAGVGGGLAHDVHTLALMRGLTGITYGVFGSAGFGLIVELFEDETERANIIGGVGAVMAAAAVLLATVSGFVTVMDWHKAFLLYLIAVPMLAMFYLFLPFTPPEGQSARSHRPSNKPTLPYFKVLPICVAAFAMNLLWMIIYYFVGVYIEEGNLGDASVTGIMSSVLTAGSFIGGVRFSLYYRFFNRFTPVVFFLTLGACYFVMSYHVNIYIVAIMILLAGWTYGLSYAYYYLKVTTAVPTGVVSLSAAVLNASMGLASYFSPFALQLYQYTFSVKTLAGALSYIAITTVLCGFISIALALKKRSDSLGTLSNPHG